MVNSFDSSSFHIVPSSLSPPLLFLVSPYFIYISFVCLILWYLHMHLNNCVLNFVRYWFETKFICMGYSTKLKMPQDLIKSKNCGYIVDENGEPLYHTNCNMPSSNNHLGPILLHHESNLFYNTPIICGCLKCKRVECEPSMCHTFPLY
jgi:hypothetical protein